MNCPTCDAKLKAVEKHGIEVDICPDCKGVWLDRGELEKLVEMAETDGPVRQRAPEAERPRFRDDDHDRHDDDHHHSDREHGQRYSSGSGSKKRKGSWLGDVLGSFGGED